MNRRSTLVLFMVVGFFGGILANFVSAKLVHAQEHPPAEKVVTAQRFVLVNEQGSSAGIIGFDKSGSPEITLFDAQGNVIWSTKVRTEKISH